jgi:ATP-dependent DNA helicase PIF1
MRAQTDPWFADYMLRIGNGTEEVNENDDVRLPDEICVSYTWDSEKDLDTLFEIIFPNLNENMANKDYITSRAILSTRNDWVDDINLKMINKFQGGEVVLSVFKPLDLHGRYPQEGRRWGSP